MEQKTPKFETFFNELESLGKSTFVLRGSTLVVEILNEEELKSKGGIIMSAPSNHARGSAEEHRLHVAKVLMTGEGYVDEEGNAVPTDVKKGAMVILPKYAPQFVSIFPGISEPTNNRIALVKEDQILAYYPTQEAYEAAKKISEA
jgi:co-chaperonin GroES (HSP10)